MLHLQPTPSADQESRPYAEAVARLASIRHALRLVDVHGGGPAPDPDSDEQIAMAWDEAGAARRRQFDRRSAASVNATAAGLEALLGEHGQGRAPHQEASRTMVEEIRRELADIARVIL
ncbi:MAG: hypothetical protein ACREBK_03515 [Sphingomicrobium sp.]